jgi:hypothetical protein
MPIIAPRTPRQLRHLAIAAALFSTVSATALAQPADSLRDPGPRGGQADSGGPLPGLGEHEIAFFRGALAQLTTVDSVTARPATRKWVWRRWMGRRMRCRLS